ncbi:TIGR04222 domain-containing membrane protein [Rhodococcus sp. IEGM 1409]|uniref:TIGR04222 domain-containing membrane protein n=1 Tax=Rhodococcus sp. IEGM 1409 TaxID=3047082 RepID=UPI0024B7CCA9|nr:TIGR04222 domain-containing membrane protein [Rhodococcus sp. IEGM 1409]MDI9901922.1 TIGR04222 domain-containing membrane protein [Rhodococcus sp. IEGM 1409]
MHNHTDTWGISTEAFLGWYIAAATGAVVIALAIRGVALRKPTPELRTLTPPEMGVLTSDERAVRAAMAELESAAQTSGQGQHGRFTRIVRQRIDDAGGTAVPSQLVPTLPLPLLELRSNLVQAGYLNGNRERTLTRLTVVPVLIVAVVGTIRAGFTVVNENPVGYLPLVVICLTLVAVTLLRLSRRTRVGQVELRRLKDEYSYLTPSSRPSFATYGAASVGIAAALFGPGRDGGWAPGCGGGSSPSSCSAFSSTVSCGG